MSEDPTGRGPRSDPQPRLRAAALTAVIAGVLLLAAAAFALSYAGIHRIALAAGVSPGLARLYPLIFDAMLVIAGAAVLAMRAAGWAARAYVWGCLLLLLAAVATGDAVHAMNIALPRQQSRAAVAVTPWVLLLLAFGLWLVMLRYLRKARLVSRHTRPSTQPGHVRLAPATAGAPGIRALPAGGTDAATPPPAVAPATGTPATGLGYPPDEGPAASPASGSGVHPGQGSYPAAHSARPGPGAPGGQADSAGYAGTDDYAGHVVYAEPEIAGAGEDGEDGEAAPEPGPAEDGAGHGGEETGQDAGPGRPAPAVAAPAPIPQFDRLRSSPTPPRD